MRISSPSCRPAAVSATTQTHPRAASGFGSWRRAQAGATHTIEFLLEPAARNEHRDGDGKRNSFARKMSSPCIETVAEQASSRRCRTSHAADRAAYMTHSRKGNHHATRNDRTRPHGREHGAATHRRRPRLRGLRHVAAGRGCNGQGKSRRRCFARRSRQEADETSGSVADGARRRRRQDDRRPAAASRVR
jgi:hypothetical protein